MNRYHLEVENPIRPGWNRVPVQANKPGWQVEGGNWFTTDYGVAEREVLTRRWRSAVQMMRTYTVRIIKTGDHGVEVVAQYRNGKWEEVTDSPITR